MRIASTLPFAAAASAIVLPNVQDTQAWADFLPTRENVENSVDNFVSTIKKDFDAFATSIEEAISAAGDSLSSSLESVLSEEELSQEELSPFGGHDHHGHEDKTIYEIIKESDYTSKFASIVDEHESIVQLLNSTKANYTLFVPINAAFEHIPDHPDHKPSKEFVEALLKYHVGEGLYPAGRILTTHTLPTALQESWLGDRPQRLRTSVGFIGHRNTVHLTKNSLLHTADPQDLRWHGSRGLLSIRVNFYNRVVSADHFAKNGVIHAVRHLLVPPPMVGRELSLFPSKFSTLLLAYEKTDFVKFIHNVNMKDGSTVFAPSNTAFERLGPGANAFLFNTEKGIKYLRALLKYHIVANETLYSDEYYQSKGAEVVDLAGADGDAEEQGLKHYHVDLPSLLEEKNIAVDITRWGGFIDVKVNGYVHVAIQDGVARNGVIHVVDNVLLPHRKPGDHEESITGEISVEDLVQRLEPFVEKDESTENEWTDL